MSPRPMQLIGASEASALLKRDKTTVIRWAHEGRVGHDGSREEVLTVIGKLAGKNGAILFNRRQVIALAARMADDE